MSIELAGTLCVMFVIITGGILLVAANIKDFIDFKDDAKDHHED